MQKRELGADEGSHLAELVAQLDGDEVRVLTFVAERLVKGRKVYGALDSRSDERDFRLECGEEIADMMVYAAALTLRQMTSSFSRAMELEQQRVEKGSCR